MPRTAVVDGVPRFAERFEDEIEGWEVLARGAGLDHPVYVA